MFNAVSGWCLVACIWHIVMLQCSTEVDNCNNACREGRKPAQHARFSCHSNCVDLLEAACGIEHGADDSDADDD